MTEAEYRQMLKKEIIKFKCVSRVRIQRKDMFIIYKNKNRIDKDEFLTYLLEKNKDKYNVLNEEDNYIVVEILGLEKFAGPKTDLDLKIEQLENELKELKEKRKKEIEIYNKKIKVEQLKQKIKELEGE